MTRKLLDYRSVTVPFSSSRTNARELVRLLSGCGTILDIGCGRASPVRFVHNARLLGVDAFEQDIGQARTLGTHDDFVVCDARNIRTRFRPKEFDACVALDLIEHLTKEEGLGLVRDMEVLAKKRVVVFTPNGFLSQASREEGDFQEHKSGWEVQEMKELGFQVLGLCGLKGLRTTEHRLKFRPRPFWAVVSWLTQWLWCRSRPEHAAAILCWKDVQSSSAPCPEPLNSETQPSTDRPEK